MILGTTFLSFFILSGQVSETPSEFPERALKQALALAEKKSRLITAEFWTYYKEPSASYSKKTLSKPAVCKWLSRYAVGARINFNFNRKLRNRFHITDLPAVILLDTDLNMWCKIQGSEKPDQIVAMLEKGRQIRQRFIEAQKSVNDNPDDPALQLALTEGYIAMENTVKAENSLTKLHSLDPEQKTGCHEELAFELGHIYDVRKKNMKAEDLYRLSAKWAKGGRKDIRASVLYSLANLQIRRDKFEKAIAVLQLMLTEFKKLPEPSDEIIFVPHRSEVLYALALQYLKYKTGRNKGEELLHTIREQYTGRFAEAAENYLRRLEMQKNQK